MELLGLEHWAWPAEENETGPDQAAPWHFCSPWHGFVCIKRRFTDMAKKKSLTKKTKKVRLFNPTPITQHTIRPGRRHFVQTIF